PKIPSSQDCKAEVFMISSRRGLLKNGLLVAGAAITGAAAADVLRTTDSPATHPAPEGPSTPALTTDHNLVHVHSNGRVSLNVLPPQTSVREGAPGRKWIMVIDLAKCDGCKKCTEACTKMHHTPADREWIKVFHMQDSPETAP